MPIKTRTLELTMNADAAKYLRSVFTGVYIITNGTGAEENLIKFLDDFITKLDVMIDRLEGDGDA